MKDLSNLVFGKWTVLRKDLSNTRKNVHWVCKCECGTEKSVDVYHLHRGKSTSCRKCSEHKSKNRLGSRIWSRVKHRCKLKKRDLNLGKTDKESKEYLYKILIEQGFKCALSGVDICLANTIEEDMQGHTTASIDRIDSSKGYVVGNVQWVHKVVNQMKMDLEEQYFIEMCVNIARQKKANYAK